MHQLTARAPLSRDNIAFHTYEQLTPLNYDKKPFGFKNILVQASKPDAWKMQQGKFWLDIKKMLSQSK